MGSTRAARTARERNTAWDVPPRTPHDHARGERHAFDRGGLQAEVTRDEVRQLLLEGFQPPCAITDAPQTRRSGFQEFGLPYATDAAITRYLAAFLSNHRAQLARDAGESAHDPARPDVVLFNGGFFHSPALRERLLDVLRSWFDGRTDNPHARPTPRGNRCVGTRSPGSAVARGAAYYGMVLRGEGIRIAADLARTYYLGVGNVSKSTTVEDVAPEANDQRPTTNDQYALCVAPASAEPVKKSSSRDRWGACLAARRVSAVCFEHTVDRCAGEVIPVEREHLKALAPIRTVLQARGKSSN